MAASASLTRIDLNADLGESFAAWSMGDDAAMLEVVSSANVACGFHAGDPQVLLDTCQQAADRQVMVGAHVSYRDLAGFGRHFIDLPADRLFAEVVYQLGAIRAAAQITGARLGYVKPHGALYNAIVHHREQAQAVVQAVVAVDPSLVLLGLAGSVSAHCAREAGLVTADEIFADRAYLPDGTLQPRSQPGAVLHDPELIAERILTWTREGTLQAVDGSTIEITADSICVHGDTPGAVAVAARLRRELTRAQITVAPFVR